MGVKITRRGQPPRFNAAAVEREIKRFVPGAVIDRVGRGLDIKGQPFAPYSPRYRAFLRRGGESQQIDLRLSGGLMNSVKARGALIEANRVTVTIGPDTGTSPVWKPKAGGEKRYNRAMRKFERMSAAGDYSTHVAGRQMSRAYRMQRVAGKQSPQHDIVGYWLHHGTPTMKARPWLGLAPDQEAYLRQRIAAIMWR